MVRRSKSKKSSLWDNEAYARQQLGCRQWPQLSKRGPSPHQHSVSMVQCRVCFRFPPPPSRQEVSFAQVKTRENQTCPVRYSNLEKHGRLKLKTPGGGGGASSPKTLGYDLNC